ncbi:MAG: hypothetical protein L3J79_10910, partial [Candidatus Marinimicrobia bacterium]|nr:hypothetical protein [Candidatus Neomarinimicrobiota bacterium]
MLNLDPTPKYIITTEACMAPRWYGDAGNSSWLKNARRLDAVLMSTAPDVKKIVDDLFNSILDQVEQSGAVKKPKAKKSLYRLKQTTKVILLNLYVAYLLDVPVRYSRNRNWYGSNKRYGYLFFKYSRVIPCVDALVHLGLVQERRGFNDKAKGIGRESRIWATPKLISLFHQVELHRPERVIPGDIQELIELRNDEKEPVSYQDTDSTSKMRDRLKNYNNFITQQEIALLLDTSQHISLNTLDNELYTPCLTGKLNLLRLELDTEQITKYQMRRNPVQYTTVAGVAPSITKTNFDFNSVIK